MTSTSGRPDPTVSQLIRDIPKVELHLHIEGTLEPEMVFALAAKHRCRLRYPSVADLRSAYSFRDLQSFLDVYYAGCDVLRDEDDFYALTMAYLRRAHDDGVVHAEIFFDPQTHTARGVPMGVVVAGIRRALADGERLFGITSGLILCFLRHLSQDDAWATLEAATPFLADISGVGLDSGERGNPPGRFTGVFAAARQLGLRTVAHAGEEGPAEYVREALDLLRVERIDHGVHCEDDDALVQQLAATQVPLTMCPLSNLRLGVVDRLEEHNLARLLARGVRVTINSDDPAYFGGYLVDNYLAACAALDLGPDEVRQLATNAVFASWLPAARKSQLATAISAI